MKFSQPKDKGIWLPNAANPSIIGKCGQRAIEEDGGIIYFDFTIPGFKCIASCSQPFDSTIMELQVPIIHLLPHHYTQHA